VEAEYGDVYYTQVRCLIRDKLLKRVFGLKDKIGQSMASKGKEIYQLQDPE
jgi:hypothetical protein